MHVIAS